jgi:hypothetical protein
MEVDALDVVDVRRRSHASTASNASARAGLAA